MDDKRYARRKYNKEIQVMVLPKSTPFLMTPHAEVFTLDTQQGGGQQSDIPSP